MEIAYEFIKYGLSSASNYSAYDGELYYTFTNDEYIIKGEH